MTFYEELSKEKNPAIIQVGNYLLGREDIQENLQKPNKSLKECWNYIVSEARKKQQGGCACLSDLEKESEELHHCVKTYAQRYQDQKTNIMFVRDVHEVTKPYATLEFKDKKVIQFRAKNNLRPSDEAVSFVREWADMNRLECNL